MSVNDAHARLSKASRDLTVQWHDLKSGWQDEASAFFEKTYIEPLEHELKKSILAMEQLAALSAKIQGHCG